VVIPERGEGVVIPERSEGVVIPERSEGGTPSGAKASGLPPRGACCAVTQAEIVFGVCLRGAWFDAEAMLMLIESGARHAHPYERTLLTAEEVARIRAAGEIARSAAAVSLAPLRVSSFAGIHGGPVGTPSGARASGRDEDEEDEEDELEAEELGRSGVIEAARAMWDVSSAMGLEAGGAWWMGGEVAMGVTAPSLRSELQLAPSLRIASASRPRSELQLAPSLRSELQLPSPSLAQPPPATPAANRLGAAGAGAVPGSPTLRIFVTAMCCLLGCVLLADVIACSYGRCYLLNF
jgi:hypothetical protein